jgi:hypothetical protein
MVSSSGTVRSNWPRRVRIASHVTLRRSLTSEMVDSACMRRCASTIAKSARDCDNREKISSEG